MNVVMYCGMGLFLILLFLWAPKEKSWPYFLVAVIAIITVIYSLAVSKLMISIVWSIYAVLLFGMGVRNARKH